MKKLFLFPVLLVLLLSAVSVALADGPPTETDLPPEIDDPPPSSVELVVGNHAGNMAGTEALCSSMWWHGISNLTSSSMPNGDHYSRSRDENNHSYPCDIDKIGTRGRLWSDNVLRDDTGMKTAPNSADKQVFSSNGGADFCDSDYIYIFGNHHFEDAGQPTWQPTTSNSC